MSNKTTLQSNNALISQSNTSLQALINTANALPDAGGGSSGGSVETCNLTVSRLMRSNLAYISVDEHNQITTVIQENAAAAWNLTAICGSCFVVYSTDLDFSSSELDIVTFGCSLVYAGKGIIVGKITAAANESVYLYVNTTTT